ncbi:MAG: phage baseplate assembly protein V, partial [Ruminococcus sp.]|nr:phage baseplate assembly protein V [Ruminococcus sp.]
MDGIVSAVSVDYGITSTKAEITITSQSLLLQEKGEERIFQNPEKTYADILKNFENVEIGKCEHINDKVKEIIYQHNTDDFSFLLYLAHKCGTGLWITEDGQVSFGMINNTKSISDSEKIYKKAVLEKTVTAQKNGRQINILTMEHIPNGSVLKNEQSEYIICETYVHEKCDETYFRYIGFTNPVFEEELYKPESIITTAKVTDNKDPENLGRIQVDFVEFSDKDSEKIWIDYTTPFVGSDNGGCVFIPDIDNKIIVCISGGKAYALNSLRVNALPDNCRDVTKKYFAVRDSVITVDDKEISAKQSDKTSYKMNADSIIAEHNKAEISLD